MSLANELRIGNWVEILGNSKRLDFFTTIQPSSFSVNIDKTYGAIPLDEDWLQKFGFNSDALDYSVCAGGINSNYRFSESYFVKKFEPLQIANGVNYVLDTPTGSFYSFMIDDDIYICQLQYVHQLQNLFFAVTQTELQFKNDQPNL
jgi:hypothetical protein